MYHMRRYSPIHHATISKWASNHALYGQHLPLHHFKRNECVAKPFPIAHEKHIKRKIRQAIVRVRILIVNAIWQWHKVAIILVRLNQYLTMDTVLLLNLMRNINAITNSIQKVKNSFSLMMCSAKHSIALKMENIHTKWKYTKWHTYRYQRYS